LDWGLGPKKLIYWNGVVKNQGVRKGAIIGGGLIYLIVGGNAGIRAL